MDARAIEAFGRVEPQGNPVQRLPNYPSSDSYRQLNYVYIVLERCCDGNANSRDR